MGAKAVDINENTGKRIKLLLKEHHRTQEWLAEILNITPVNLSYIVNGKRGLTLERGKIIANYFGVRVEWIMGSDNYKTEQDKIVSDYMTCCEQMDDEMKGFDSLAKRFGYGFIAGQTRDIDDPSCVSILKENKIVSTCSYRAYFDAIEDIRDYAHFRIIKLIQREAQRKGDEV